MEHRVQKETLTKEETLFLKKNEKREMNNMKAESRSNGPFQTPLSTEAKNRIFTTRNRLFLQWELFDDFFTNKQPHSSKHNSSSNRHNNNSSSRYNSNNNRFEQLCDQYCFSQRVDLTVEPQLLAHRGRWRQCRKEAEAAPFALVVATRAAHGGCCPGHVSTPFSPTRTEEGQDWGGGSREEQHGDGPGASSSPAGALQSLRRAWRYAAQRRTVEQIEEFVPMVQILDAPVPREGASFPAVLE